MVMQATQVGGGNDFALLWWLDGPGGRRIALQRQVRPDVVVVLDVLGQDVSQVALVERYHVVETFPLNRADYPFGIWILPRGSRLTRPDHLLGDRGFGHGVA